MSARAFLDTNVLIYAVSNEASKRERAETLLLDLEETVISTQVVGEFVSVCLKKHLLETDAVAEVISGFMESFDLVPVEATTLRDALGLHARYGYGWWDSLILASALEAGCDVLYTEDLQADQRIDDRLRITNPFQ